MAQLLSTTVTGTLNVSSTLNAASFITAAGLNVAQTAAAYANGGSVQVGSLNFVNTSTVAVSVVAGAGTSAGNANVSFISGTAITPTLSVAALSTYLVGVTGTSGTFTPNVASTVYYTPSTGIITAGGFTTVGNISMTPAAGTGYITQPTLKSYREYYQSASVTTATSVDLSTGNYFDYTLTGSPVAFTFNNAPTSGNAFSFVVVIRQDGTGGRTASFANTIQWPGALIPPFTTTASANDMWSFVTFNGGTSYVGSLASRNFK
jgi:hypothetical protein